MARKPAASKPSEIKNPFVSDAPRDTQPAPAAAIGSFFAGEEPAAEAPAADRLPLQAQPARRRVTAAKDEPTVCASTYAIVSTGQRGKIDTIPLHEVPLLRRKIQLQEPAAETPKVLAEFPEHLDRYRPKKMADLRAEHARLVERYTFDKPASNNGEQINLVADFYGSNLTNLRNAMVRLEQGMRQIAGALKDDEALSDEQMEELVALACDPDFDLNSGGEGQIEYQEFEPGLKGQGFVVPSR
jgi:hypothetical protein